MYKIFCERLRKLRTDKELSQAKLAKILGTYQQTIGAWENGTTEPDIETVTRLAVFFDVTADYLLGLSNDISKSNEVNIGNKSVNSSFQNINIKQK